MFIRLLERLLPHSVYDVLGTVSFVLVFTTGTSMAVANQGTVYSQDIVDGEVNTADLANNAVTSTRIDNGQVRARDLAQPVWRAVRAGSTTGNACATQTGTFCSDSIDDLWFPWKNYSDTTFDTAGFSKDGFGFVHLKGLVQNDTAGVMAGDSPPFTSRVFVLPAGFRPAKRVVLTSVGAGSGYDPASHTVARIDVEPNGDVLFIWSCKTVRTHDPSSGSDQTTDIDCTAFGNSWVSLDGLEFSAA